MDYKETKKLFYKKIEGKELTTVRLEKNMTLERVNKSFIINLYSTPIITILPNELFRLSSGNKFTNLVKSRMEKYSPVNLKQIDGWWWIVDKKEKILSLYYERILIDKNGKPTIKISEKSIIFKRLVLILNQMINQLSDSKISDAMGGESLMSVKSYTKNETNNLIELLASSSKDIKSMYCYYYNTNYDVTKNGNQLIYDMLKFGGINNYNEYAEMKNNAFKSKEKLLKAYFIPYMLNQLKFILKQKIKEKEKINA